MNADIIELARTVTVAETNSGGFLSAITFPHAGTYARNAVSYFAPGMIYGSPAHLSADAIGGANTYGTNGHGIVRIREDRLPAPIFGIRFKDGSALTVMDPAPKGETTRADSHDTQVQTLTDGHFQFGAIGADLGGGHQTQGFWFPGSEGESPIAGTPIREARCMNGGVAIILFATVSSSSIVFNFASHEMLLFRITTEMPGDGLTTISSPP